MTAPRTILNVLPFLVLGHNLQGQVPLPSSTLPKYPGIRTQFNQSLSQAVTNEQRLALFGETVAQGRHSGRPMMQRMFGNFAPGSFNLDPNTPGLATTVRQLASDNRNVVIGHART